MRLDVSPIDNSSKFSRFGSNTNCAKSWSWLLSDDDDDDADADKCAAFEAAAACIVVVASAAAAADVDAKAPYAKCEFSVDGMSAIVSMMKKW